MRNWKVVWISLLLVGMTSGFCGCAFVEYLANDADVIQEETTVPTPTTELQEEELTQADAEVSTEEIPEIYYAYHVLDESRQKLYREILGALVDMKESVELSTLDKSLIDTVFYSVMNDHPELFYVEGYQYTEYSVNNETTSVMFQGTYSMSPEEAQALKEQINRGLEACFHEVPTDGDEYSAVKYLYDYLINNTEYDKDAPNNQNICSVFLQGRSVCQGYAKAMQYMLQTMGIQAMVVTGFTNGERHAWNLVRVNGAYYYVDPTWGDASYSYNGESGYSVGAPPINYDYFLVTTDELTRTHSIEKVVALPECVSVVDNYFVRENLYFEFYDENKLAQLFDSEAVRTSDYVTIKCSTSAVYDELMQRLIDEQAVFDFISNQGESIAYTSNQYQRTVSFWNIFY